MWIPSTFGIFLRLPTFQGCLKERGKRTPEAIFVGGDFNGAAHKVDEIGLEVYLASKCTYVSGRASDLFC